MYLKKIYHCILHKIDVFFLIRLFVILTSPTGIASNFYRKMTNLFPFTLVSQALHDREASTQFSFVLVCVNYHPQETVVDPVRFIIIIFITDSLYSSLYIVFASLNL